MYVVAPASPFRRGVRRLALALCALILGAGFTPALPPATADPGAVIVAAPVSSTVDVSVAVPASLATEPGFPDASVGIEKVDGAPVTILRGVAVCAAAGRAPPSIPA